MRHPCGPAGRWALGGKGKGSTRRPAAHWAGRRRTGPDPPRTNRGRSAASGTEPCRASRGLPRAATAGTGGRAARSWQGRGRVPHNRCVQDHSAHDVGRRLFFVFAPDAQQSAPPGDGRAPPDWRRSRSRWPGLGLGRTLGRARAGIAGGPRAAAAPIARPGARESQNGRVFLWPWLPSPPNERRTGSQKSGFRP
jgi:hypothetical protein